MSTKFYRSRSVWAVHHRPRPGPGKFSFNRHGLEDLKSRFEWLLSGVQRTVYSSMVDFRSRPFSVIQRLGQICDYVGAMYEFEHYFAPKFSARLAPERRALRSHECSRLVRRAAATIAAILASVAVFAEPQTKSFDAPSNDNEEIFRWPFEPSGRVTCRMSIEKTRHRNRHSPSSTVVEMFRHVPSFSIWVSENDELELPKRNDRMFVFGVSLEKDGSREYQLQVFDADTSYHFPFLGLSGEGIQEYRLAVEWRDGRYFRYLGSEDNGNFGRGEFLHPTINPKYVYVAAAAITGSAECEFETTQ